MLTPTEAARLILENIAPLPVLRQPLREALDLVLAEDVAILRPARMSSLWSRSTISSPDPMNATRGARWTSGVPCAMDASTPS